MTLVAATSQLSTSKTVEEVTSEYEVTDVYGRATVLIYYGGLTTSSNANDSQTCDPLRHEYLEPSI